MSNLYVFMTTAGTAGVVIAAIAAVVLFIVGFNAFKKSKEIKADYVEEVVEETPVETTIPAAESHSEVKEEPPAPAVAEERSTSVTKLVMSDIELKAILLNEDSSTPKKDALDVLILKGWTKEEATVYVNSFIQRNHLKWNFQTRKYEVRM